MIKRSLSVALPWSLSHYIPLNAFHPLYRPLIDECPSHVTLNAWDNIELSNIMRSEVKLRDEFCASIKSCRTDFLAQLNTPLSEKYDQAFFLPNILLTSSLMGDIELHHTAPFPSMTRPFVFHCESFAPIFFPFAQQGGGTFENAEILRHHYAKIFSNPLCLGIFSHIPHTLKEISRFFGLDEIDKKLYPSRCGVAGRFSDQKIEDKLARLFAPCFVFINSANQNPDNFVHRGGHIILQFWLFFIKTCPGAKLYLRCSRPSDEILENLNIDLRDLRQEESRSVIWIQDFVSNGELNRLVSNAHFFLLPSASLHSVSIMQAMALGSIPVVSDTVGTNRYVKDGENGVILTGMHSCNWKIDETTGILLDCYHRNQALEGDMVRQMLIHVTRLIAAPDEYARMHQNAQISASTEFSGAAFATEFWESVNELWNRHMATASSTPIANSRHADVTQCLVDPADWPRIFESVPQPMSRIYTGRGRVTELGGAFIYTPGDARIDVHDWSVLAEYYSETAPPLVFVHSINELGGIYLTAVQKTSPRPLVSFVAKLLFPYPGLYRIASRILRILRKLFRKNGSYLEPQHVDIQLVAQDISGMNIIRAGGNYYAIPQHEGAFSEEKANNNGYGRCFKASSLKRVLAKIEEEESKLVTRGEVTATQKYVPVLVEQGLMEFNIIYCGETFFAIPQAAGAFDYDVAIKNGYKRMHAGADLEQVRLAVLENAHDKI